MLVSVLPVPFADAGRQRQYDAVLAALHAEADAPATVLLGNLGAFTPFETDVLLVRPAGLTLLVLTPHAGHLTLPAQLKGQWQLDGQPPLGYEGVLNPLAQYQQQLPPVLNWVSEQFGLAEDELLPSRGIALFDAPLTFGPAVEAQLHRHTAAHDFQLVGDAALLPARLRQPAAPPILDAEELLDWGEFLANESYITHEQGPPESPFAGLGTYLEQKLRQLWGWLGAEDIPADPPYGGGPPDQHLRDQQEQARLQLLRHELQVELHQQRQEATAREAARTQELAQLRQQLAQAGQSATERQAEQQATAKLEGELRTARAELAARNQELDTRIRQLGLLIKQLQATAKPTQPLAIVTAAPIGQPVQARTISTLPTNRSAVKPRPASFRRLRQAERWGVVALVLAGLGAGTWGVVRLAHPSNPRAATRAVPHKRLGFRTEGETTPNVVYVVDSTLAPAPAETDDTTLHSVDKEPAASPETPAPAKQLADSAATPATATPAPDSAATPSPTP